MTTGDAEVIRVLLVDDHQMVRQGLRFFLSTQAGFEIVGEARNGEEAVALAAEQRPDVVLMDLMLPEMDGLEATCTIRSHYEEVEVLVLTSYISDEKVVSAIKCGASGYLMKDVNPQELARAIRAAARGEVYLHTEAARHLADAMRPDSEAAGEPAPEVLTEREVEVLALIARGLSNQDIATQLTIAPKTVKGHVSSILQKLALDSRVQAALYALRHQIVELEST